MAAVSTSQAPARDPSRFIGTWWRFERVGPVYEVVGRDRPLADGGWLMRVRVRVRVVETGEEVGYRLTDILDDPAEG